MKSMFCASLCAIIIVGGCSSNPPACNIPPGQVATECDPSYCAGKYEPTCTSGYSLECVCETLPCCPGQLICNFDCVAN